MVDAQRLIARVPQALAEFRDVSVSEIVSDVLSVGFDVIMSTIPTKYVVQEAVALDRVPKPHQWDA